MLTMSMSVSGVYCGSVVLWYCGIMVWVEWLVVYHLLETFGVGTEQSIENGMFNAVDSL